MTWEILATTDYPAIRAVLDTSLTEANLPDAIIGLSIYADNAVQDVRNAYEAAGTADDPADETDADKQARITRAAIYFCAARLAPAVVRITSVSVATRDATYSRQTFDPTERAAELRADAAAELVPILEPTEETPGMPTMFTVGRGYRGR